MPEPDTQLDPNAPWSPEEAAAETQLTTEELALLKSQIPVIEEVLSWFAEQIATYSNPETIMGVNPSSKPTDVKNAVLFAQQLIKDYKYKRNDFTRRFKQYMETVDKTKE